MKIDSIYMLYKNSNKYFNSYNEAYFHGKDKGFERTVYYVFTPTMNEFKYVRDLYIFAKNYFRKNFDSDYLDIINRRMYKQLKLV